ncbi:MAG: hypothetical protein RML15_02275 [Bacteroidota bacterium]|nr:hypothetical protein [Candidatus Kapabacteria bacterium]MCX7936416.1 hypothetical protein [Chlorobiota bacterium]MDW8074304.1 hypothetical protein [Bacteroidota bacterium]MDW8271220.1 hypothetical protein [Bacteroidota bacterium]
MLSSYAKILLGVMASAGLLAQDFDWVPTYMLPFRIPTTYYVAASRIATAAVYDRQSVEEGSSLCATYGDGWGWYGAFSFGTEWWIFPRSAMSVHAAVGWLSVEHRAAGTIAPLVTGEILQTEYVLSTSRPVISVQVSAKTRIGLRHSWISGGLEILLLLPAMVHQVERVQAPAWYQFATNPPTRQVEIGSSRTATQIRPLLNIAIGYDWALTYGVYCSPSVEIGIPLTLARGDYRLWHVGIAVPIAFSLF